MYLLRVRAHIALALELNGAKGWSNLIQHPVLIAPDQYNSHTYFIPTFLRITGAMLCIARTAFLTAYFSINIDKKASTKQDLIKLCSPDLKKCH